VAITAQPTIFIRARSDTLALQGKLEHGTIPILGTMHSVNNRPRPPARLVSRVRGHPGGIHRFVVAKNFTLGNCSGCLFLLQIDFSFHQTLK
jgi:hypothetical protein